MSRPKTTLAIAALLLTWLAGCVSVPSATVSDTARAICPTPLTASQALRIADALDNLPPGSDLDALATQIERLDAGARICKGTD
jgi:hypothetical protein